MSLIQEDLYEIDTRQGMAWLLHKTPNSVQTPILLIHGFGSGPEIWVDSSDSLGNHLIHKGADVYVLDLSNSVWGDLTILAHEEVWAALKFVFEKRNQQVHLIGHSLGGLIARFLVSRHFDHPYSISSVTRMINNISLLATPNHGINMQSKAKNVWERFHNYFRSKMFLFQLDPHSKLITGLNQREALIPEIKWKNAVGLYDRIVPVSSARFEENEIPSRVTLEQRVFSVDHMVFPLSKLTQLFRKVHPAIHHSPEVTLWILDDIQT